MSSTNQTNSTLSNQKRVASHIDDQPKELGMMEAHRADVSRFRGRGQNMRANEPVSADTMRGLIAEHRRAQAELFAIADYGLEVGTTPELAIEEENARQKELRTAIEYLVANARAAHDSDASNLAHEYLHDAKTDNFTIEHAWQMPREWMFIVRDHYRQPNGGRDNMVRPFESDGAADAMITAHRAAVARFIDSVNRDTGPGLENRELQDEITANMHAEFVAALNVMVAANSDLSDEDREKIRLYESETSGNRYTDTLSRIWDLPGDAISALAKWYRGDLVERK